MNFVSASSSEEIILYCYFYLLLYFRPRIDHLFDLWRLTIARVHVSYISVFRGTMQ